MLPEALAMIERGRIEGAPQDSREATWLPKKLPDRRIDWMQNARRTYDLVRALTDRGAMATTPGVALGLPVLPLPGRTRCPQSIARPDRTSPA